MDRFISAFLLDWKIKKTRKPLIIRGARQVGKTHVVREFAKHQFEGIIEINFEKTPRLKELFIDRTPRKILDLLQIEYNADIKPSATLLFLDEIQAAPEVIAGLRYFYEECPELHVIAAGSLLEFVLADHRFSMPVGRIEYLHMGPLTFEEFLVAAGQERLRTYLKDYELAESIPISIHEQLLEWFRTYCLVGGMPQAVRTYLEEKSFARCEEVKHGILSTYQDDFGKYGVKIAYPRLRKVLEQVPRLVGEKIKYVNIDPNERAKDLHHSLLLLEMAKVCTRVCHTSANGLPLGAEADDKVFKLLFLDVGLMASACGLTLLDFEKAGDIDLVNQGKVSEQVVGQQLLYREPPYIPPTLHYWVREARGSAAEVDYIISIGSQVIPVEIKSGKTGRLKSLHVFLQEKKRGLGVRVSSQMPSILHTETSLLHHDRIPFTLVSVPFYLVEQLDRLVQSLIPKINKFDA